MGAKDVGGNAWLGVDMRIGLGRRQLIVRFEQGGPRCKVEPYPMAVNASDAELARLASMWSGAADRARWETTALMYGASRLRGA